MRESLGLLLPAILLITPLRTTAHDFVIPAGALLQCTVSDPKFSSKTAELDDPLLCHFSSGRWLLPSGTYLVGRFEEYRDPGHFIGKGWIRLNFDRMVVSDRVIPLTAKVVYVPDLPVDRKGRIHGRGHPVRDAVEWSLPVLWPMKVATLPMRGPRPTLKNETRLTVKVMDDVIVPGVGVANALFRSSGDSWADKSWPRDSSLLQNPPHLSLSPSTIDLSMPVHDPQVAALASGEQKKRESALTLLILKDGRAYVASNYWFEDGQRIRFISADGTRKATAIENLDYAQTVEINRERGVNFVIRSETIEHQE